MHGQYNVKFSLDTSAFSHIKIFWQIVGNFTEVFHTKPLCLTDPGDGAVRTSFVPGGFSVQSEHLGRDTSVSILSSL
jgi:hypothetical protein